MRRARGFTLVELMVVVAITTVIASIAILAMRKNRTENDCDGFANAVRTAMIQARRRAVATRNPYGYMVHVQKKSVRWCMVDPSTVQTAPSLQAQATCPPPTAGLETGGLVYAGSDAQADYWAAQADITTPTGTNSNLTLASSKTSMPSTGVAIYFGANGTCSDNFGVANGLAAGIPAGDTVYVEPISTSGNGTTKQRKVVLLGASARPRVVDRW